MSSLTVVDKNLLSLPCSEHSPFELLPTELLEIIFDYSHHNITSLKACSTVSRTFHPICQAHIFHTVTLECINFDGAGGRCTLPTLSQFLDAISISPHNASLVRELRFTKPHDCRLGSVLIPKVVHERMVAQILMGLPQLTTFVMRVNVLMLPSLLAEPLSHVIQLPTLRHLDLGCSYMIPAFFSRGLTNLQILRFGDMAPPIAPDHEVEPLVTIEDVQGRANGLSEGQHLQSLSILSNMPFPTFHTLFVSSTRVLDITHLQELTLAFIRDESLVREILKVCGETLTTFNMNMQGGGENSGELDLGFQYLHHVTSLTLSFAPSSGSLAIRWLDRAMSTLPSPKILKQFTLIFEPRMSQLSRWDDARWSTIDTLRVAFPGLVSLRLLFLVKPGGSGEGRMKLVRMCIPQLTAMDIFELKSISELPSCFC